jgi:hypothetical protein
MNTLCVYCQQPLKFGPESIGREFPCPRCGRNIRIDATGIVPPPSPPPPSAAFESLAEEEDEEPIRRKRPKAVVKSRGGNGFADFLLFRAMLTPWIIQIIFWLGTLFSVGVGMMMILAAIKTGADIRGGSETMARGVIYGMAVVFLGPLFVRLYCEGMIIFFRIHEELCDLHTTMARKR